MQAMASFLSTTGDVGSAPGTLAPKDMKKWLKTTLYLMGSAMAAAGLDTALDAVQALDLSGVTVDLFGVFKISGTQIAGGALNLIAYAIELLKKDSR